MTIHPPRTWVVARRHTRPRRTRAQHGVPVWSVVQGVSCNSLCLYCTHTCYLLRLTLNKNIYATQRRKNARRSRERREGSGRRHGSSDHRTLASPRPRRQTILTRDSRRDFLFGNFREIIINKKAQSDREPGLRARVQREGNENK